MICSYAVSFEYDTRPVQTTRGQVSASHVGTCARLATKNAILAQRPKGWRSLVVVLERTEGERV